MSRVQRTILLVVVMGRALTSVSIGAAEPPQTAPTLLATPTNETARLVEIRGGVVCLAEEMHREHKAELPTRHEHLWGFKGADGQCYTILRGRYSEAIWLDERLRTRELLLKARLFPKSQIIELQSIKSIRDGVVQDLFYYCKICAIKSIAPGPCDCCRGPVELMERPLTDKDE